MYKLQKHNGVLVAVTIIGKTISIPLDPTNSDYQAYLQWLAEGNTPEPADA